jgi:hypothetical protein
MHWFKVVLLVFFAYEFVVALLGSKKNRFTLKRGGWAIIHLLLGLGTYFFVP